VGGILPSSGVLSVATGGGGRPGFARSRRAAGRPVVGPLRWGSATGASSVAADRSRDRAHRAVRLRGVPPDRQASESRAGIAQAPGMRTASISPRAHKATQAPLRRFFWAQIFVACAFLLLIGRLLQLQVQQGDHYFKKSADNFIKELSLPATRGQIRDQKGRP